MVDWWGLDSFTLRHSNPKVSGNKVTQDVTYTHNACPLHLPPHLYTYLSPTFLPHLYLHLFRTCISSILRLLSLPPLSPSHLPFLTFLSPPRLSSHLPLTSNLSLSLTFPHTSPPSLTSLTLHLPFIILASSSSLLLLALPTPPVASHPHTVK